MIFRKGQWQAKSRVKDVTSIIASGKLRSPQSNKHLINDLILTICKRLSSDTNVFQLSMSAFNSPECSLISCRLKTITAKGGSVCFIWLNDYSQVQRIEEKHLKWDNNNKHLSIIPTKISIDWSLTKYFPLKSDNLISLNCPSLSTAVPLNSGAGFWIWGVISICLQEEKRRKSFKINHAPNLIHVWLQMSRQM